MAKEPADSVDFFENRIRPVLVEHCYECHSATSDEIGGSLLLDSSDSMMTGGDSGPAITPGDADASILVSALRYESSEMPPAGKLPDAIIDDFQSWIAAGAVDPRTASTPVGKLDAEIDLDEGRKFWAFRPLGFAISQSPKTGASNGSIDQYLDEKLFEAGIIPVEQADPATRLRRLAFDLTGLPPTIELQKAWSAEPTPLHWQRIVDSMLASPEFAQHWARHWMDVARYADSNGSDFNATFHEAWRYREYLVRSFAADQPFDLMIRQQIAGDLLPADSDDIRRDNIVASTFLMLGTKMLSERDKAKLVMDVVDEQIDTVGRAFLGLTLGCARCHDHKFDPVPMEDYYALAGIFKSTVTLKGESQEYVSTWNRVPLPTTAEHRQAIEVYETAKKKLKSEIATVEAELKKAQSITSTNFIGTIVDDTQATKTGFWKASTYSQPFVGDGYLHDDNAAKGEATIEFAATLPADGTYEVRLAFTPSGNRASNVPISIATADGVTTVKLDQRKQVGGSMWASLGTFRFQSATPAVVTISNEGTDGYVIADAAAFIEQNDSTGESDPEKSTETDSAVEVAQERLDSLTAELKRLQATAPLSLPEAMAPSDQPSFEIADCPVHIRGEIGNLGEIVPRGFLRVCSSGEASIPSPRGSGRLELADWLTDPDHPLVARVFVNRVWMHLMGEGIVRTVDNFGQRGERPSHPMLLDSLATDFIRGGWHLKPLVREIVTSDAYQRSSRYDAKSISIDPENRLWWRMHRRRIPAEAIRDAMVAATGMLDPTPTTDLMSGHGVLVSGNDSGSSAGKIEGIDVPRRSIHLPIVRGFLSPMMTALDMADPDLLVGRRPTTNVPGQALVLINSPEVDAWAKATSVRVLDHAGSFDELITVAYQICLQRLPSDDDREFAMKFFGEDSESPQAWHQWIAATFAGTEFRLLD